MRVCTQRLAVCAVVPVLTALFAYRKPRLRSHFTGRRLKLRLLPLRHWLGSPEADRAELSGKGASALLVDWLSAKT